MLSYGLISVEKNACVVLSVEELIPPTNKFTTLRMCLPQLTKRLFAKDFSPWKKMLMQKPP